MARGWDWIDDGDGITEEQMAEREPLLNELARQWSEIHDAEERRHFARMSDIEDGRDDYEFESDEDERKHKALQTLRAEQQAAQVRFIEGKMHELGARMMRPYEHWNEDERYMQYMECDRFGDSC